MKSQICKMIRVAIVEDSDDIREGLAFIINSSAGYLCVKTFANAEDAVLGMEEANPEVVLMDINLPGISGIEVLKILRNDPATAHIPVLALSANAMPSDIEKGMQAGFYRYLTKPIKVREFMDTLNAALEITENKFGHGT